MFTVQFHNKWAFDLRTPSDGCLLHYRNTATKQQCTHAELKGNHTQKYTFLRFIPDLITGPLMWFKHFCEHRKSQFGVYLLKMCAFHVCISFKNVCRSKTGKNKTGKTLFEKKMELAKKYKQILKGPTNVFIWA